MRYGLEVIPFGRFYKAIPKNKYPVNTTTDQKTTDIDRLPHLLFSGRPLGPVVGFGHLLLWNSLRGK